MKITVESISKNFILLLLGFTLSGSLLFAQNNGPQTSKSNLKIFIQYRLIQKNLLTNDNIKVDVTGNQIILTGTVPTLYDKNQAEEEAHSVDENYTIINDLKVENTNVADSILTEKILDKIQSNLFYGVFDWLTVNSNNGIVTLRGWVHLPWLKTQFQNEIEKIPGVYGVKNEVMNSFGPSDLGIAAARLIYNDVMFWKMQYSANPPIHIIDNNGSIILEGYVSSELQRKWAENIIQYRIDANSIKNNLHIIK